MRLIDKKELIKRVPFSLSSIARWEKNGTFPQRMKVGISGRCVWSEDEVATWISQKLAERPAPSNNGGS
jgi:predicted DNA-binding transcriptional regulator AlpA